MITVLLQELMTASTHNGTVNYLFRKPQNCPLFLRREIAPNERTFTLFLMSKTMVQNLNIEITLANSNANVIALSYDSAIGVSFEFVRYQVICEPCKRLNFAPMLRSPMVGLFWCVFNMKSVQYIVLPQMATIKSSIFHVDEFIVSKGKFHTMVNNKVVSSKGVPTLYYKYLGIHVEKRYSFINQFCLECTKRENTLRSQCSCDESGQIRGGMCYTQINPTEILEDTNGKYYYFLECNEGIRSTVELDYKFNTTVAVEYRTFKDVSCGMSHLVLKGELTFSGVAPAENRIYGITNTAQNIVQSINISLTIMQTNPGMGSSSLMLNSTSIYTTFKLIRISGKLLSKEATSNSAFSLFEVHSGALEGIEELGIFGGELEVSSDYAAFLIANYDSDYFMAIYITVAPGVPEEYQILSNSEVDSLSVANTRFSCFSYSMLEQEKSLRFQSYFEFLTELNATYPESQITIFLKGGNNIGGLIGSSGADSAFVLYESSLMLNIVNHDLEDDRKQYIGLLAGKIQQSIDISYCYVEGNVTSQSDYVGVIGELNYATEGWNIFDMAAKVILHGNEYIGLFGYFQGGKGTFTFNNMVDIKIIGKEKFGLIGEIKNANLESSFTGTVLLQNGSNANIIGNNAGGFMIYEVEEEKGALKEIPSSSVNFCSDDQLSRIIVIQVTDLQKQVLDGKTHYYATECEESVAFNLDVKKSIGGKQVIKILKDDACNPSNIRISGELTVETVESGLTELEIYGYTQRLLSSVVYVNQSLKISHIGLNGTRLVSMIAFEATTCTSIEFLRINGTVVADTKSDIAIGCYAAFVLIQRAISKELDINNIGLFGAEMNVTGFDAVGLLSCVLESSYVKMSNILISNNSTTNNLISESPFDYNYFYEDLCGAQLSNNRENSLNYEEYEREGREGRRSVIVISTRKARRVSFCVGYIDKQKTTSSVNFDGVSVSGDIIIGTDTSVVGMLVGYCNGYVSALTVYVEGNLRAKHKAGMIGELISYSSISAVVRLNITGLSMLGTVGAVSDSAASLSLYFDNIIKYEQNYAGGAIGYIIKSPYFEMQSLVCRSVLIGVGKPAGLVIGYQDEATGRNYYTGSMVNVC